MGKERTCFFIGHHKLPRANLEQIVVNLDHEIDQLLKQNVTTFISGGMLGFDLIAAALVTYKKQTNRQIRLVFALPYVDSLHSLRPDQKRFFHQLQVEAAAEVICVTDKYQPDCIQRQQRYMVAHAAICICALHRPSPRIEHTLQYARQQGLRVVNVAEHLRVCGLRGSSG